MKLEINMKIIKYNKDNQLNIKENKKEGINEKQQ